MQYQFFFREYYASLFDGNSTKYLRQPRVTPQDAESSKAQAEAAKKQDRYGAQNYYQAAISKGWFAKSGLTPFESVFYTPFRDVIYCLELDAALQ